MRKKERLEGAVTQPRDVNTVREQGEGHVKEGRGEAGSGGKNIIISKEEVHTLKNLKSSNS